MDMGMFRPELARKRPFDRPAKALAGGGAGG